MPRQINNSNLITFYVPKSPISEAYRTLRTNIQFSSIDKKIRVLMVASAQSGEGKSTTVSNLAVTYAQEGKKVLLIDADLRKPTIHRIFGLSNRTGLTSVITGQFHSSEAIQSTEVENLSILPSGAVPPNPAELLASQKMKAFINEMKDTYDIIIFDTPPVLAVADSLIVSSVCDGVVIVIQEGKVKRELVKRAKESLERVNAKLIGVVLNNVKKSKKNGYYYYYHETAE
ncbi:CpsD/CapB family tyrosine-protein kinase [Paenibacillus beijingensis]|uniref:non-specific protein-tyrosine kinase n=1 Tax=Paenibacillus beijingensis TaxID=1126833 RepID=A0A0D5NGD5_9BACL|nr:CpsD/CapB family tyrosine-protein kinase [Paenibacillus beijingensis]AJY73978.1 capsular biosynthesis protein [Paenibacillus beijingensis]